MASRDETLFSLREVRVRFGSTWALDGIDLEVGAGERVALIGPSGAGKTTLLSMLNGRLSPTAGAVRVLGQDLDRLRGSARRRVQAQVGTIYQQLDLVGSLRVVHNVNAGRIGGWALWKAAASLLWPREVPAVARALERVGVPEKIYERTDQLSVGQQQRVALARVLLQDPVAIVADEPISSLDPARALEIMDLLRELVVELGKTLVVSLHAYEYALSHCDRVVGLRQGRILFDQPAQQVSAAMVSDLYRVESPARR